jgi:hypothetical protein
VTTFKTQADVQQRQADSEFQRQVRVGLDQIYTKHQKFRPCEANDRFIVEFCSRFVGADVAPTLAIFELALEENPGTKFAVQHVENQKEAIIDQIIHLLGTGGKYTSFDLQTERKRLSTFSRDALIARREDIKEKQLLNKIPVRELQRQVHNHYSVQNQRPTLPAEYTSERIKDRSFPVSELKRLIRMYGADIVNDRLFGRS